MIISGDDPGTKDFQRFEVFTGAGKRREWPPEEKALIVTECYAGVETVSAVARRHGLVPSQLFAWRRDLRKRFENEGLALPSAAPEAAAFVPAVIEPGAAQDLAPMRRVLRRRRRAAAVVELEINGVAVQIARGADAGVITAVIEALRATR
jgi:transposase